MTWLNAKGGSLIVRNGALAVGEGCCCTPLPGDCTPCTAQDGSQGVIVGGECVAGADCGGGCLPRRNFGGGVQLFYNNGWVTVDFEILDFTNPASYYYYCYSFTCDALQPGCSPIATGEDLPQYAYNFGQGYYRCSSCSQGPIGTLCDAGDGPLPAYGVPDYYPELFVQPGESCLLYYYCDLDTGDCGAYQYLRDSQAGADLVADCSECVPWYVCTTNGAQLLGYGKSARFANSFDEFQRPLYQGVPIVSSGNECSYLCHPANGCTPSHDGVIASCDSCVPFADPGNECAFVAYGISAADLGNENLVPADVCVPLYACDQQNGCVPSSEGTADACSSCEPFCDPANDCEFVGWAAAASDLGVGLTHCSECNPLP